MCGRFAQPRSSDELARIFGAAATASLPGGRYNVAPTDEVSAVVEHHGERAVEAFRWGLVPVFARGPRDGARLINARAETVERSPAFGVSFRRRRCIVPADAFYEWRRDATPESGTPAREAMPAHGGRRGRSDPFAVRPRGGGILALAGLWAVWRDPETAARLYSCTILTTSPNALLAPIHGRMPVILDPADWDAWLDERTPVDVLRPMLAPAPGGGLEAYPVSPAVSNVRSEGPELLAPLTRWVD
jgi:putative SOS response-associated peptidase YedK